MVLSRLKSIIPLYNPSTFTAADAHILLVNKSSLPVHAMQIKSGEETPQTGSDTLPTQFSRQKTTMSKMVSMSGVAVDLREILFYSL